MSKGRMAKRISVFALCALFVCCCIALTFSLVQGYAAEGDEQRTLLFEDDCRDLSSPNIVSKSDGLSIEHGFKRPDTNDAYITFAANDEIGKITFSLWHDQGFSGVNWALTVGNPLVSVLVSRSADGEFTEVPFTYAEGALSEDGTTALTDVTVENLTAGYTHFRIMLQGDVAWNPQLYSVAAYGRLAEEEGLLMADDCTAAPAHSTNITVDPAHGYKRDTTDPGVVAYALGGTLESVSIDVWFENGALADMEWAYNTGVGVRAYVAESIPSDLTSTEGLTEITLTWADEGTANTFTGSGTFEGGEYGVLVLRVLGVGAAWTPQVVHVSAYGTPGEVPEPEPEPEPEPGEEPFFTDPCTDLIEVSYFDDNIKTDPRGLTRTDKNPGGVVYVTDEAVGRVELELNILGGYPAWEFDVNRENYSIRIFVAESYGSPYAELSYTASSGSSVGSDGWGIVKIESDTIPSDVQCVRLLMDANGNMESWGVCVRTVELFSSNGEGVEATSVQITNTTLQFTAGESLAFTAETDPAGALVFFSVWDDEDLTVPSSVASFDSNVLTADFSDATDRTVWVVAKSGSAASQPVAVTILHKPDAESVTLGADKTAFVFGESVRLTSSVLPANAINTAVAYAAYLDESCAQPAEGVSFSGDTMTLEDEFTAEAFWVKARVLRSDGTYCESDPLAFTVIYKKVLLSDDCSDFSNVDQSRSDMTYFELHNGTIHKVFSSALAQPNYAVLGPGSVRTDAEKHGVPHLVYAAYGDISDFNISVIVYDENNGALIAANKNNYIGLVNIYGSADGESWTYIPVDFTASNDVGSLFDKSNYSKLDLFNTGEIPAGTRYIRIDFVGQVSLQETQSGTDWTYAGHAGGIIYEEDYDEIVLFYNSYSPLLKSVSLYAEGDAAIDSEVVELYGAEGMSVHIGGSLELELYQVRTDSDGPLRITDFTGVEYRFVAGAEYVDLQDGTGILTVKEGYTGGAQTVRFTPVYEGLVGEEIEVRILVPVTKVSVTAEKTQLTVGESVTLRAEVAPADATLAAVEWVLEEGEGVLLADGTFRATAAGTVKIAAIADGVRSETIELQVSESGAETPEPPAAEPEGIPAWALAVIIVSCVLIAGAAVLIIRTVIVRRRK